MKKVLVIEDNEASLELVSYLLKSFGYTALAARNGEDGVKTALAEIPDLVICDIHMPKLDGMSVVSVFKSSQVLNKVPIIAVTALAMVGDKEKFLASGFDGYVSKPIEPTEFIPYISSFLGKENAAKQ